MTRAVAITLKIPDNTAYTAAVALRSLGLPVEHVERSEIWLFDGAGDARALLERVQSDATIFNPNKHRADVLDEARPREGEVWIESLDTPSSGHPERTPRRAAIAWRLFVSGHRRADRRLLDAAAVGLLCNPAIERPLPFDSARSASVAQDDIGDGGEY